MVVMNLFGLLLSASSVAAAVIGSELDLRSDSPSIDQCPGYCATNVRKSGNQTVAADLSLDGSPCNVYGTDLTTLKLQVEYQSNERLHVKIYDAAEQVYQVPQSVLPRPPNNGANNSDLVFSMIEQPFSFYVSRKSSGEVLFNSSAASFIFESQYVRLRTSLPNSPSLYGMGEHSDNFMLNTTNYTRTLWSRDAGNIPPGTNLYGNHPVYFDHRGANGTHGVFLLNSNGMDVKINNTAEDGQYLEYNLLGGVIDLYFLSGPTPQDVAVQYSEIVGLPAMHSYWALGFHQCRYGMQDVYEVAAVVANYSASNIPLETMWTDIDYMDARKVFTLDPLRFPLNLMQQLVSYLHSHQQHYVVMVDPAVAYQDYPPFNNGVNDSAFLTVANGSVYKGVVWPGVTAFPDWFAPNTQDYWDGEFSTFFDPKSGVDIDALWIDMNEASNFCTYPCNNPEAFAKQNGDPPLPPAVRLGPPYSIPGFPADFQPQCVAQVQFDVNATTYYGENIAVIGNVSSLGDGIVSNSAPLNANDYPIWMGLIDLPVNTTVSYQYVRLEEGGSYIFENRNRTLVTGNCDGTVQVVTDQITTAEGTPPSTRRLARRAMQDAKLSTSPQPAFTRDIRQKLQRQTAGNMSGLSGRNLIDPPYSIQNAAGSLSNLTIDTDLIHANGLAMYDTHNMYGTMMSSASRFAMLNRRPTVRPLVITRSTFAGAGAHVGHWLGDNTADWEHYLISIGQLLQFASLYQVPMVGSDVCGFNGNTNMNLCSRWATLGAFSPFYRNHNNNEAIPHEFYRWPQVAAAARNAIATRYQLLDYIYTAMYRQTTTGVPLLSPMFFAYPNDTATFDLQYQYLYGDSVLVAPVTEENSTVGSVYFPKDIWYDFYNHTTVHGNGSWVTLPNVPFTTIPLFIRGGSIIPMRNESANTTTQLRTKDFTLIIAPGLDGNAQGSLYLDDGESLVQNGTSLIDFSYVNGTFSIKGSFGYNIGKVGITDLVVLGRGNGTTTKAKREVLKEKIPLTGKFSTVLQ